MKRKTKALLLGVMGGILAAAAGGCSTFVPDDKTQTVCVFAIGIPGMAFIRQVAQTADNSGGDTNDNYQNNPVDADPAFGNK